MRKKINYKIGFEDGEVSSYLRTNDQLIVKVKAWNEIELTLIFQDAIGAADYGVRSISELVEEDGSSELMNRVLAEAYDSLPTHYPYKLYQFLNLDGAASLEVVAQSFNISE